MSSTSRLQNFPISFFAMIMGLSGLTIAWEKTQQVFNLELMMDRALIPFTTALFIGLTALYAAKTVKYRQSVIKELHHPIKLNFFPAISISMILLSICMIGFWHNGALGLWSLGTLLHLGFTLYVMNAWMHRESYEIHHINPAWFIPVVGNVLIPVAGTEFGFMEISWFAFSVGMLFWIVLLAIIFYRVLFHNPLPAKLMPTLFILIAPPAVGFIAYTKLTGDIDAFARVLYYAGLFLTLLLFTQVRRFSKLQFFLSWWAYSFPIAAITIASLLMYHTTGRPFFAVISWGLLSILTLLVVFLLYRTLKAVGNRQICLEEE
jgi:tellurite resistance protein